MCNLVTGTGRSGTFRQVGPTHECVRRQIAVRSTPFCWQPSTAVSRFLPDRFEIQFVRIDEADRWPLEPALDLSEFITQAALAGQAIQQSQGLLSSEHAATYKKMRLLFQLGPRLRERLDRRLRSFSDLVIRPRRARCPDGESQPAGSALQVQDILPEDLGTAAGHRRWTLTEFLEIGHQAAIEAEIETPTLEEKIAHGIDVDASQRPENLTGQSHAEPMQRLRTILFDVGVNPQRIDDDLKGRVYARFVDAIQRHVDDSTEAFNHWFFSELNGIVRQISKKKGEGDPIDRAQVREALLEFVFDSWSYVGPAVTWLMEDIHCCISAWPAVLDQASFEAIYFANNTFGEIPLVALHEQFPQIQPSVSNVLNHPDDPQAWGRLHRALQTYAAMLVNIRLADRERKAKRQDDTSMRTVEEHPGRPEDADGLREQFRELASRLFDRRGIRCQCPTGPNWNFIGPQSSSEGDRVLIVGRCRRCRTQQSVRITTVELRQASAQLFPDDDE